MKHIILILFLFVSVAAFAQPRGQWKYFEKSAGPGYMARTANADSVGRWVPMQSVFDTLLSSYNVVYGSGIADYVARWVTDSTLGTGLFRDDGIGTAIGMTPNSTYALRINGSVYFRDDGNAIYSNSGNYFCPECSTNRMDFYNGIGSIRFIKPAGNSILFYKNSATSANLLYEFSDNDIEVNVGVGFSDRTLPDDYTFIPRTASGAWPGASRTQIWGNRIDNIINSPGATANATWSLYNGADSTTVVDYDLTTGWTVYEGNLAVGSNNDTYALEINTTDAALMPDGTTAQRPTGTTGLFRFNTDSTWFEGHNGTDWVKFGATVSGTGTAGTPVEWGSGNTLTEVSLTEGSVVFVDAGGGLTEDNTNFFFDDSNDRLYPEGGVFTQTGDLLLGSADTEYFRMESADGDIHIQARVGIGGVVSDDIMFGVGDTTTSTSSSLVSASAQIISLQNSASNTGGIRSTMFTGMYNESTAYNDQIFTNWNYTDISNADSTRYLSGIFNEVDFTGTSGHNEVNVYDAFIFSDDAAYVSNISAFRASTNINSGTFENVYGFYISGLTASGTATFQNRYGIYINNFGGTAPSGNNYGIYIASTTAKNYFGGNVGIGTLNASYTLDMGSKTGGARLPVGTTGQRPTGAAGVVRYNSTTSLLEFHNGTTWASLAAGAGSMSSWLLNTNSDGTTSITDGEEVGFDGGSGIATSRSSNDVTVAVSGFYTSFNTYSGDPGTLTPSRGAVIGFDAVSTGWTQVINTSNLATGDEIYIKMVNTDTNAMTLDVDVSGGFIRPKANGDFAADLTESFTSVYHSLTLVWDGTDFWIFENE